MSTPARTSDRCSPIMLSAPRDALAQMPSANAARVAALDSMNLQTPSPKRSLAETASGEDQQLVQCKRWFGHCSRSPH